MAMQKVHDCTRLRLVELRDKLNEDRVKSGQKKLTIPDIIDMMTNELLSSI